MSIYEGYSKEVVVVWEGCVTSNPLLSFVCAF